MEKGMVCEKQKPAGMTGPSHTKLARVPHFARPRNERFDRRPLLIHIKSMNICQNGI